MVLKRLTCPTCDLRLGGYDEKTATVVLDVAAHPTIAFFVDAPSSPNVDADATRSTITIACPACGRRTALPAASIRFGKKKDEGNGRSAR